MSFSHTIHREKLYEQMENNYEELSKLDPKKLLMFLRTENDNIKMEFKYYSEFLNIFNTLVFLYVISNQYKNYTIYTLKNQTYNPFYDLYIFIFLDTPFLLFSLVYYFITKNKKIGVNSSQKIFVYSCISVIISKIFFNHVYLEEKSFKLFVVCISIIFLCTYDYSTHSHSTGSNLNKICYTLFYFIISLNCKPMLLKVRLLFYVIK